MEPAVVDGITLEYEVAGSGEPVVFIHGAFIADTFRPLLTEPSLVGRYRLISYHRRGYGGSSRTPGPISVARQAADCRTLLRHLDVGRAHVVGHSLGGAIALQLALDAPAVVHSLALLEPALFVGASGPSYREALARGAQRYREAGAAAFTDESLRARWPGYREALDRILPGAYEQALADARTVVELDSGHLDWRFGEAEARRITQPALSVVGGESEALWACFGETQRLLLAWLPKCLSQNLAQLMPPSGDEGGARWRATTIPRRRRRSGGCRTTCGRSCGRCCRRRRRPRRRAGRSWRSGGCSTGSSTC